MNTPRTSLTTTQIACVRHLVEDGWTAVKCRATYNIPTSTWYNWRADGKFVPAIDEAKSLQREGIWSAIAAAATEAVGVLRTTMLDPAEKGSVRIQAAQDLLNRAGYGKSEPPPPAAQPYATREEMIAALAAIPQDVLQAALLARSNAP